MTRGSLGGGVARGTLRWSVAVLRNGARAFGEDTRVKGLVWPRVLRHEVIGRRMLPRDRAHQRPFELVDESLERRPALHKRGIEIGTWSASKDSGVQRAPSLITGRRTTHTALVVLAVVVVGG